MRKTMIILAALVFAVGTIAIADPGWGGKGDCNHRGAKGMHQGPGHARGGGEGGDRPGVQHLLRVADELELTDAQRDQLRDLLVEFRTERVDKEAVLEKARINMRALVTDDEASEGNVMRAIDDVAAAQAALMKMRFTHHKTATDVLTDEQQTRLKELRRERWAERGPQRDGDGPHGRRGGGGGGR